MKIYAYDLDGFLIGQTVADVCPVTEKARKEQSERTLKPGEKKIAPEYILPAYTTPVEPLKVKEGFYQMFDGSKWAEFPLPEKPVKETTLEQEHSEPKEERKLSYMEKRVGEYPDHVHYFEALAKTKSNVKGIKEEGEKELKIFTNTYLAVMEKFPKE